MHGMNRNVRKGRGRRGVFALEYILVCALVVIGAAMAMPVAIELMGSAFDVVAEVICSPFPAGL